MGAVAARTGHSAGWLSAYRAAAPEDTAQRDVVAQLALPIRADQTREQARRVAALEAQIALMRPSVARRLHARLTAPSDPLGQLFRLTLHRATVASLLQQLDGKRRGVDRVDPPWDPVPPRTTPPVRKPPPAARPPVRPKPVQRTPTPPVPPKPPRAPTPPGYRPLPPWRPPWMAPGSDTVPSDRPSDWAQSPEQGGGRDRLGPVGRAQGGLVHRDGEGAGSGLAGPPDHRGRAGGPRRDGR